jgi:hypothetical protein
MVAFVSSDPTHPIATSAQTFKPPHDVAYPIYISTDIQACSPIDVDLANIVVVAQRGTCPFSVKADNVLKAGGEQTLHNKSHYVSIVSFADKLVSLALRFGSAGVQQRRRLFYR